MSQAKTHPGCNSCRFWDEDIPHDIHQFGFCRRHSPHIRYDTTSTTTDARGWGHWPLTCWDDWCGEYQEAPHADAT